MTEMSGFTLDTAPTPGKLLFELDTADHSMASTGTDKRVSISAVGQVITGWADLTRDYGADPTGGTSIATPLANACSAAVAAQPATVGLTVPPGIFKVDTPQAIPWNMVIRGAGATGGDVTGQYVGSVFKVASTMSITDGYVFLLADNAAHTSAVHNMSGVFIDGSLQTSSAVNALMISGPAMCTLTDVTIAQMSGWAVMTGTDTSASEIGPYGQTWTRVTANSNGTVSGGGFNLTWCEDSVFDHCYALGNNNGPGFLVQSCDNTKFVGCNSEWSEGTDGHGFYVTGDWQWATGGCQFIGCSTDANSQYGFYIDATWTTGGGAGTGPGIIHVVGCHFRRDGQGQSGVGTGTYAGIGVGATTLPLIVSGFSTMPSIGDGGGGSMAPTYGIYFTNATYSQPILFANGLAWGYTTGVYHGATGGSAGSGFPAGVTNSAIMLAHGNNYAPTYGS